MSHKYVVQIIYKSGRDVTVICDDFTVKSRPSTGDITEVQWENSSPMPMFINIEEIESIWRLVGAEYDA